jgi:hypothetical protein
MDEGAKAGELGNHIRARRETPHAGTPLRHKGRSGVFEHAGVLKDESDLGTAGGKFGRALHLPGENL